jgi:hypothetical protein
MGRVVKLGVVVRVQRGGDALKCGAVFCKTASLCEIAQHGNVDALLFRKLTHFTTPIRS